MKKIIFLLLFNSLLMFGNNLTFENIKEFYLDVKSITQNDDRTMLIATDLGIYKSIDSNSSWIETNFKIKSNFIRNLQNGNLLIATDSSNLYISNKYLNNWNKSKGLPEVLTIIDFIEKDGVYFISNFNDGVYRSNDFGFNWIKLENYPVKKNKILEWKELKIHFSNTADSKIYTISDGSNGYVYYSNDYGNNWDSIHVGFISKDFEIDNDKNIYVISSNGYLYKGNYPNYNFKKVENSVGYQFLKKDNFGNIIYVNEPSEFFKTTDKGKSWINLGIKYFPRDINISKDNDLLVAGNNALFYKINDSIPTKEYIFVKLYNKNITSISKNNQEEIFVGTYFGEVYYSNYKMNYWNKLEKLRSLNKQINDILCISKDTMYIISDSIGHIFRSNDRFNSLIIDSIGISTLHFTKIFKNDKFLYLCTNKGLYYKEVDSINWKIFDTNFKERINDFLIDSTIIYIASDKRGVLYSNITENNFTPMNLNLNNLNINKLVQNSKKELYLGTNGDGVFKFDKNSNKWQNINSNLNSNTLIVQALFCTKNDEILVSILDYGINYSNNDGKFWELNQFDNGRSFYNETTQFLLFNDSLIVIPRRSENIATCNHIENYKLPTNSWVKYDGYYQTVTDVGYNKVFFCGEKDVFYSLANNNKIKKWDFSLGNVIDYTVCPFVGIKDQNTNISYIDSSLILLTNPSLVMPTSAGQDTVKVYLFNYKNNLVSKSINLLVDKFDKYSGGSSNRSMFISSLWFDKKNNRLLLNMTIFWPDGSQSSYNSKPFSTLIDFENGNEIKNFGTNTIGNVLIDTINNTYFFYLNGKYIKTNINGEEILTLEKPYGRANGIYSPQLFDNGKKLIGFSNDDSGPNKFKGNIFIWDYFTGKLIDSIESSNLEEFKETNYFNPYLEMTFSAHQDKIIFSCDKIIKIWDIKSKKINKTIKITTDYVHTSFAMPGYNSIIFNKVFIDHWDVAHNYLLKFDLDEIIELDVDEILNSSSFSIYPNPASDFIEILLDSPSIKMGLGDALSLSNWGVSFEIFNIFGEKISTPSSLRDATPQEGNYKIDISNLTPGVYFIKIGEKFQKFVKL